MVGIHTGWGAPCDDPLYNPKLARMSQRGVSQLARALPGTRLTSLDLSGQRAGDFGAKALARVLHGTYEQRSAVKLKYLGLDGNDIGDDGAIPLVDCFTNVFTDVVALRLAMNRRTRGGIRRRFNVGVCDATPERRASVLWVRPERCSLVQK